MPAGACPPRGGILSLLGRNSDETWRSADDQDFSCALSHVIFTFALSAHTEPCKPTPQPLESTDVPGTISAYAK